MDFEAIAPSFGSAGTGIKGILKNEPGDGAGQRLPIAETLIVFCRYFNIDTTLVNENKINMPQKRIPLKPGYTYHIWTHANGDDNLFRSEENYNYFLNRYLHHVHLVVETYAYCLMPNHLHLMVKIRSEEEVLDFLREKKKDPTLQGFETLGGFSNIISRQFSHLFNGYTQAFNKKYNRKGSLFIPNFKRKIIDSDEYFVRLIAYIHNNPVHHGFTKNLNDWPYSSWSAYVLDKITKVNKEEALALFGGIENFTEIHRELNFEECITLFER
ncbi:MAG: hypothetical protein WD059_10580 [Balneolaceae bacterium]